MVRRLLGSCCAAVLFAVAACAVAGETGLRSYTLADQSALELTVPKAWREDIKSASDGMPPTLTFQPASGAAFKVLVTPITPPPGAPAPDLAALKAQVEKAQREAAPQALEKHIALRELRGPHAAGYYFSATDKHPGSGPDDYRLMTQAEVRAGGAILVMTVLSNDDSGKVREQALALLKSARHRASDQGVAITKTQAGYQVTAPASALMLTLPEPHLVQAEGPAAAGGPRYFSFRDRAQGLIISGWFEPADSFPGIHPFWTNETAAWKQNGLPGPVDAAFLKVGDWDAIAYDITLPVPNATDTHLRAERVQDGTWIDLHLSLTSSLSSAEARAKLQAILKAIAVQKK